MVNFKYLGGIIPMMFAQFTIVVFLVVFFYNRSRVRQSTPGVAQPSLFEAFFHGQPFEHVYQSRMGGFKWNIVLLCTRFASFSFFLSIPCTWNYIKNHGYNYKYFTQWNIDLICTYFFLATICSGIGIYHDTKRQKDEKNVSSIDFHLIKTLQPWPIYIEVISHGMQVLFEVAGGSALFVTAIVFILLNPRFEFWNVADHFVTSLALLLELYFNNLVIRFEHLTFNLAWALLYLIFIWPAVRLNTVKNWPYDFLYTDSTTAYLWYSILFVANVLFYLVWYGLSCIKVKYLMRLNNSQEERPNSHRLSTTSRLSRRKSEQASDVMLDDIPNYNNLEANYYSTNTSAPAEKGSGHGLSPMRPKDHHSDLDIEIEMK